MNTVTWVAVENPFEAEYRETMDGGWAFLDEVPGPWQDEPHAARVLTADIPAVVVRNRFGVWCGYVGLHLDHRYYGVGYTRIDVDVHGGLTFASDYLTLDEMAGLRLGAQPDLWWVGFDCGHAGDYSPALEYLLAKLGHPRDPVLFEWEVYRTIDYAVEETVALAAQLARPAP